jgi:hypothetical protein
VVNSILVLAQGIVGGQNRPTGVAKDYLDPFPDKTFPDDLSACFLFCHRVLLLKKLKSIDTKNASRLGGVC